jgi:hypothetical protein|tara:strand:+ start:2447 stop:2650 length:204 start_codon:yes stop_codon:yes gene_type:complete
MNEYEHKINQARLKYPLKKTILLNPVIGMMVDEFGKEYPQSKERNIIETEKFLVRLEMTYKQECRLL